MQLVHHAHTLLKQFFHNLDEADWASRHVTDRGPDLPQPAQLYGADEPVSSLSMALGQMGLVRQTPERPLADFDS